MQLYLAAVPEQRQAAASYRQALAHVAYRIGPESSLLSRPLPSGLRGGLLSLSDADAPPIQDPERLSAALVRECQRRHFQGVLLDFERTPSEDRLRFIRCLAQALGRELLLFLPPACQEAAPGACSLLNTALSGGTFADFLHAQKNPERCALDVERLRMDFALPARSGRGTPLSPAAFQQLMEQRHPTVFFSKALCARYFTYFQEERLHLVLFDDAETIRQKLRLGRSMGFHSAFLMYPEVSDLLPALFPRSGGPARR